MSQGQHEGLAFIAGLTGEQEAAEGKEQQRAQAIHGTILNLRRGRAVPGVTGTKRQNRQLAVLSQQGLSMLKHGRDGLFVADAANGFGQHGRERQLLDLSTAFISAVSGMESVMISSSITEFLMFSTAEPEKTG